MKTTRLSRSSVFSSAVAVATVLVLGVCTSQAANRVWDGGGDGVNWADPANWVGDVAPVDGDSVTFTGSTTTNNNLTAGTTIAGITLDAAGTATTIGGNAIKLGGDLVNNSTAKATLTINLAMDTNGANRTFTAGGTSWTSNQYPFIVNGEISGTGGVVKSSTSPTGRLVLANTANTFTGVMNASGSGAIVDYYSVANGGVASSLGASSSAASNLIIGGTNSTFRYQSTTSAAASTDRLFTLNGTVNFNNDGPGVISWTNTGSMTMTSGSKTFTLGGSNTGDNTLAFLLTNPSTGTFSLVKASAGTWVLTNASSNYTGTTSVNSGVLKITSIADGGLTSAMGASTNAAANLSFGGGTLEFTGSANSSTDRLFTVTSNSASNKLSSSGTGTLTFSNTGSIAYSTVDQTRTLTFGGTNTGDNTFRPLIANNGTGVVTINKTDAGKWIFTNANTYTGATTISGGTLVISSTGTLNSSSAINVSPTAGTTSRFYYNNNTSALANTITLAGNSTTSTRAVLGGSGTISSAVTLNNLGDTLAPGESPGKLTFTAAQSWDSFSYDWEVQNFVGTTAGTDFDQIAVNNTVTLSLSGTYQLNVLSLTALGASGPVGGFLDQNMSWIIMTTTGLSNFDQSKWTIDLTGFSSSPAYAGSFAVSQSGNNIVLNYTAVPEPSTYAFLIMAGMGLVFFHGRRLRRSRS